MVVKQGDKISKYNILINLLLIIIFISIVTIQDDMENANFDIENSVK
jgi:hypothetical protein